MKNKVELIWSGKDQRINIEPGFLIEDPQKSRHTQGDPLDTGINGNLMIHGDNLQAMKILEKNLPVRFSASMSIRRTIPGRCISTTAIIWITDSG